MNIDPPFRISVVTDEISQDFDHACEVAARQFGMGYVELRTLWNKNVVSLMLNEISEAARIIQNRNLRGSRNRQSAIQSRLARSTNFEVRRET